MSLSSFFLARMIDLPPATDRARVTRNIAVPAGDGVLLRTDHYAPQRAGNYPTILMRLPYGRRNFGTAGEAYAERGFHAVLQSCRGTDGSGGEFDPLINERSDGLATIAWLREQPWFDGRLGLTGASYLGYAQWAICDAPEVQALTSKVTSSEFRSVVFPSGAFHLGLWLGWLQIIEGISHRSMGMFTEMMTGGIERNTLKASLKLPLIEADIAVVGHKVAFWRRWFVDAFKDPDFWDAIDHRARIGPNTAPNHFMSGWYDFMIEQLLADYGRMVELGHRPYLTIGPYFHVSGQMQLEGLKDSLIWMRWVFFGDRTLLRDKPVRIHLSGLDEWREFDAFPPGPATPRAFHLRSDRSLSPDGPIAGPPARYRYDPADPTPNIGGSIFAFSGVGPLDNAPRESRSDVLSYTSAPLDKPLTVIGNSQVHLFVRSSIGHADFFVRLCDVSPAGTSINIADGLVRITPETSAEASGLVAIAVSLNANAHSFRAGHRLRLQVSSGAHPRYARNMGTNEDIATATRMVPADIEIVHDVGHGARLELATYDLEGEPGR